LSSFSSESSEDFLAKTSSTTTGQLTISKSVQQVPLNLQEGEQLQSILSKPQAFIQDPIE